MVYTVKLDFSIDENVIRTDEEVEELVEEVFDNASLYAFNIEKLATVLEY